MRETTWDRTKRALVRAGDDDLKFIPWYRSIFIYYATDWKYFDSD